MHDNGAQDIVDAQGNAPTTLVAGESCDRKIVFDVPADSKNLQMKILFGGRVGEILDWMFYGERAFKINP
jgi:hypothetical protein